MKQVSKKGKKNVKKAVKKTANAKRDKHFPKALKNILIILLLLGLAVAFIIFSGIFNVKEIIVEGNEHVSKDQIIAFSKIEYGENIFSITNGKIEENVSEHSYVKNVNVKKAFPNKIKIEIEERGTKFIVQVAENFVYINEQGYILEISPEKTQNIELLGLKTDFANAKANDLLNQDDLNKIEELNKIIDMATKNDMADLINKIDLTDSSDYVLELESEGKKAHIGSCENLNEKFLYVKAIIKAQKGKNGEIFVNMNLNDGEYAYFSEK